MSDFKHVDGGAGATCWSDGFRSEDVPLRYGGFSYARYISLFGQRSAVRSIWARLLSRNAIDVEGYGEIMLEKGVKMITLRSVLRRRKAMAHVVMLDPNITTQCSIYAKTTMFLSYSPEIDFFERLNRFCHVPFKRDWIVFLWERGRKWNLIKEMSGWGMPGYVLDCTPEMWVKLVQEGIALKEIR